MGHGRPILNASTATFGEKMRIRQCQMLLLAFILVGGCSRPPTQTYSKRLLEVEQEFGDVYRTGSVEEVEKALHIYLHRLDELQRHPGLPDGKEISIGFLRGLSKARLAVLHHHLGNSEKEQAFVAAALTHMADKKFTSREDLFLLVEQFEKARQPAWRKQFTEQ